MENNRFYSSNILNIEIVLERINQGVCNVKELYDFMVLFEDICGISEWKFRKYFSEIEPEIRDKLPEYFGKRGKKVGNNNGVQKGNKNYGSLVKLIEEHPEYNFSEFADALGVKKQTVSDYFKRYPCLNQRLNELLNSPQGLVDTIAVGLVVKAYEVDYESAERAHKMVLDHLDAGDKSRRWMNRFLIAFEYLKFNEENGSFPSQDYIAGKVGVNRKTVGKYLTDFGL